MGDLQTPLTGPYNAAADLIGRNLSRRPDKTAFVDADGSYSHRQVAEMADRAGAGLLALGLEPGDRVAVCVLDGIDFVAAFLGAIKVGLIPIALNTLLTAEDYAHVLTDSAAKAAVVSDVLLAEFRAAVSIAGWTGVMVICGQPDGGPGLHFPALKAVMLQPPEPHPSSAEDIAFWLYSSGSTGRPKGAPHRHSSPMVTAELFASQILGLRETDVVYSAAKLFFAYGLGNALFFPMSVGATAILHPGRVTPEAVGRILADNGVSLFCGSPSLFSALLASPYAPATRQHALRTCVSAGEALPQEIGKAWTARTGVEIVDGIGSTEMLHIYLSNRPGEVRYGATGRPVPGYEVRLVGDEGQEIGPGEVGELWVRGPSMTTHYWNQPEKSAATFVDGWMKTGDKFLQTEDGWFVHCGRADDMLKVSGVWVSPSEIENALLGHAAVLEAAVIGVPDQAGLTKTKAFVVAKPGFGGGDVLAQALKAHVKARLAPYKYPRLIEFVDQLPKTATGKIRRHVLREREAATRNSNTAIA